MTVGQNLVFLAFKLLIMPITSTLLFIVAITGLVIMVVLFLKNQKDKKELVETINNEYSKPLDSNNDIEIDEKKQ